MHNWLLANYYKSAVIPLLAVIFSCTDLNLQTPERDMLLWKRQSEQTIDYKVGRPMVWEDKVFFLTYTGEGMLRLFDGEEWKEYYMPSSGSQYFRKELILPGRGGLSSFQVADSLQISEVGIADAHPRDLIWNDAVLHIGEKWQVRAQTPLLDLQPPSDSGVVEVEYRAAHSARISFKNDFSAGSMSFPPQDEFFSLAFLNPLTHVVWDAHAFDFLHLRTQYLPSFPHPLPMDIEQILTTSPEFWRNEDWEWYQWSQYPDIYLLVFRNYAIQSRFFTRLAFFAEKEDFRGRVFSDAELSGRHGWNAHNYHSYDLAEFFTLADPAILYPEEMRLQELLEEEGIIRRRNDGYVAGRGGVLSFAWEGTSILRRGLLHHEAMHGIYYSDRKFHDVVWEQWEDFPPEVQEFWRFVMSTLSYDGQYTPLVVNELQAYLLQQDKDETEAYFRSLEERLINYRPASRPYIRRVFEETLPWLMDTARVLSDYLESETGMAAGHLSRWETSE